MCGKREVSASVKVPLVGINSTKEVKSVAVYCFTQPLQPGKRDDARAIFEEIRTSRGEEYEALRLRLEIAHAAAEGAVVEARRQVRLDERRL